MSTYKKEIQDFLPADELHGNDAVVIDQPDVLNGITEEPGVTRKATAALIAEFVAASAAAAAIDGKVEAAVGREDDPAEGTVYHALSDERTARQNAIAALQALLDLGQGKGGALTAHDFGSATPAQEELIEYACSDIWGEGGAFTFDAGSPKDSAYVIGGVTHTASEIFNNTWVRNTYNNENHKWVLANTPDTQPAVYTWTDAGHDVVAGATSAYAGVMKLFNDYTGDSLEGSVTQAAIATMYGVLADAILLKLNKGGGTMTGSLSAMANPTNEAQVRNIIISATPLVPGISALASGDVYICYE
jgi:hypothetical protein